MTRYLALRSLAVAALMGACFAAVAGETRPFHGSGDESITGVNETGNVLTTDGVGVATHLGQFTRHAVITINPDLSLDGCVVFTAANGDEVWIHLEGSFITLTGNYTICGGTGRFTEATGSAEFSATFIDGDTVEFSFNGTINY